MNVDRIKGVIPPLPTLVDAQGNLDQAAMGKLLDHVIGQGVHGVLTLGTCGEFFALDHDTRLAVAEFVVGYVAGRVPVIVGIGGTCLPEVIAYGRHALHQGADAVLVINPYYAPLMPDNLYNFYQQVAENVDLPILIYNFPQLTGQNISAEMVCRLAKDFPNIVGIKDTIDNISHIRELIHQVKSQCPDFLIFAGYDDYLLDTLILGGAGGFPATANLVPSITVELYQGYQAADYSTVFEQQRALARLTQLYVLNAPLPDVLKYLLSQLGIYTPAAGINLSKAQCTALENILPLCEAKE